MGVLGDLKHLFSADFAPRGHLAVFGARFSLSRLGGVEMVLASDGWRPGMLVNILNAEDVPPCLPQNK